MRRGSDERLGEDEAPRRSHRALKLALLGGAVAVLLNEDLRNQLLDLLFGAEEEFDYSSLTEPPVPEGASEPTEPWVRAAPEPSASEPAAGDAPPDGEPVIDEQQAAADPAQAPVAPWVRGGAEDGGVDNGAPAAGDASDPPRAAGRVHIAPGPDAWRAAEPADEPAAPPADSPSPPPGWWAPSQAAAEPSDS